MLQKLLAHAFTALNILLCADVPLSNYSLTHCVQFTNCGLLVFAS